MTKVQNNNKSMQKIIKLTSMIVVKSVAITLVNVKIINSQHPDQNNAQHCP
jgi:hypothetical protein